MTTQILIFHPDLARSQANQSMVEAVTQLDDVAICDMTKLYPDPRAIDVDCEVERLLKADRLVLQFPVHWYAVPVLLKAWLDAVLTRIYYVHPDSEGVRLQGLPVLIAATAGNVVEAYGPQGVNLFSLEELLRPLEATANRCGWKWSKPFLVFRANRLTEEEIVHVGQDYAEHIACWQNDGKSGRALKP